MLSKIGIEFSLSGIKGSKRLKALIFTLVADCFDYLPFIIYQYSLENIQNNISEKLMNIIHYIEENYQKLTVFDDISDYFGMSTKTLYRFLKQNSGLTTKDLVDNCRVDSAKRMLKHTDKCIQYIADECGFGSEMTFFRVFKSMSN